ncbi:MAG: GGDEF domain-containing protein [Gammaproteobacteria bacterium]|nr:GGDEF domain-containing protein [Gammaproteobacteria bacterium]MCZ6879809.1 GGDEF domain-containing protein [Gammaproteobacteria bacterium]TDJ11065.1 MAG: diguanylate cyclase [Gammaproteobacteria bacterium]
MDFSLVPQNDPKQALRLRRFGMALISYVLWVSLGLAGYYSGILTLDQDLLLYLLGGIAVTNLLIFVVLRSGLNKHFKDPSLTLFQCLVAMCWILGLMYLSPPARDVMLMVYVMTMLFGMFRLSRGELLLLAVFALGGYGALLVFDNVLQASQDVLTRESLRYSVLIVMILWSAYFGNYVGSLKQKLRRQNHSLIRAVETATHQAERDELTRTYNRRFIMGSLDDEKIRADEENRIFSICIFDLDHFKRVNDVHGHQAGDQVLAEFTMRAGGILRSMDQVRRRGHPMGRYGGEEFIVLLPGTGLPGAINCAERIRELTEKRTFVNDIKVTVSVGVAQYRADEEIKETIQRADEALYQAKALGRNQVCAEPRFDKPQGLDTHSETVLTGRQKRLST